MPNHQATFQTNIAEARSLAGVYDYLKNSVPGLISFDDLLRSEIVYAVSAFDKLLHDLILQGIVDTFLRKRSPTPKFQSASISLENVQGLMTATTPPPEVIFEQVFRSRLKLLSFQDPEKVADGLGYIWPEPYKWQRISAIVGVDEDTVKKTLKLVVARRNSIVHEADMDPITHIKLPISRSDAEDAASFLLKVGDAIAGLV